LLLDSKAPSIPVKDYAYSETRYKMLSLSQPEQAKKLIELAQNDAKARYQYYLQLASLKYGDGEKEAEKPVPAK
jgi:pyruvate-ferredoxin/flavodoxin oxidoreductase